MITMHFDLSELTKLSDDMLAAAKEKFPRKTKAFMGRAGNRMRQKPGLHIKQISNIPKRATLYGVFPAGGLISTGKMNTLCVSSTRPPMPICLNMGMFSGLTCPVQSML